MPDPKTLIDDPGIPALAAVLDPAQLSRHLTPVLPAEWGTLREVRVDVVAEGRTLTVDWDGYGMADPSLDVARFIVSLRYVALSHLRSIRALDSVAGVSEKTCIK